jgi:hypothetical protein
VPETEVVAKDRGSLPLPDGAHLGPRPYVRPLARTRDEHDRFVLAVLSQELSRFFVSQIGQIEEVFRVKSQRLRNMLTDRVARDRLDVLVTEAVKTRRACSHIPPDSYWRSPRAVTY